jgi:hypothetical protein
LSKAYHELGDVFTQQRNFQKAEKNYQLSLDVYEKLGEKLVPLQSNPGRKSKDFRPELSGHGPAEE